MGSNSKFENYQKGLLGAEAFGRGQGAIVNPSQALSFQDQARFLVRDYLNQTLEKSDEISSVTDEQVYCVWFSKTIKNWKAMVASALPDGKYFEVTHNGDKNETYLDVYVKIDHVEIPDEA